MISWTYISRNNNENPRKSGAFLLRCCFDVCFDILEIYVKAFAVTA